MHLGGNTKQQHHSNQLTNNPVRNQHVDCTCGTYGCLLSGQLAPWPACLSQQHTCSCRLYSVHNTVCSCCLVQHRACDTYTGCTHHAATGCERFHRLRSQGGPHPPRLARHAPIKSGTLYVFLLAPAGHWRPWSCRCRAATSSSLLSWPTRLRGIAHACAHAITTYSTYSIGQRQRTGWRATGAGRKLPSVTAPWPGTHPRASPSHSCARSQQRCPPHVQKQHTHQRTHTAAPAARRAEAAAADVRKKSTLTKVAIARLADTSSSVHVCATRGFAVFAALCGLLVNGRSTK